MIANARIRPLIVLAGCILVSMPSWLFFTQRYQLFELVSGTILQPESFKLKNSSYSPKLAYEFLEAHLGQDQCVLALRQAEIVFYQSKCVVTYPDPRMVPFYKAETNELAIEVLRELKIRFIAVPRGYGMAEINHSQLGSLIADSHFTRLVLHSETFQIFELTTPEKQTADNTNRGAQSLSASDFAKYGGPISSSMLVSGGDSPFQVRSNYDLDRYAEDTLIRLTASFDGEGFYELHTLDYRLNRIGLISWWSPKYELVWEGMVAGPTSIAVMFLRRKNDSKQFRFTLRGGGGRSKVEMMKSIRYSSLDYKDDYNQENQSINNARLAGWMLNSEPPKDTNYIDWGQSRDTSNMQSYFWAKVLNERDYAVTRLLPKHGDSKFLKISISKLALASPAAIYIQWLNSNKVIKPFTKRLEEWLLEDWFLLEPELDKIEKLLGRAEMRHAKINGYYEYAVEQTSIVQVVDEGQQTLSLCIPVKTNTERSRLAFIIPQDGDEDVNLTRSIEVSNLKTEFFNTADCL